MRPQKSIALLSLLLATAAAHAAPTAAPPAFTTANIYNAPIASETLHNDRANLIVGVHGWTADPNLWWLTGTDAWNNPGMKQTLTTALGANANKYDLWGLDWRQGANSGISNGPTTANEINAQLQGQYLAKMIASGNYANVQLMGHSLGGRVVETASSILKQVRPGIKLQDTFFDAYTPYNWRLVYGSNATYADSYYTNLDTTSGILTAGQFPNALNVNMNAFVTARPPTYLPWGPDANQITIDANDESWRHNAPHRFFKDTVADPNNAIYAGYGFANSFPGGSAIPPGAASKAKGQNIVLAADGSFTSSPTAATTILNAISFPSKNVNVTGSANLSVNEPADSFSLSAFSAAGNQLGYGNFKIQLTQPANFFEFNYDWGSLASGSGRVLFYLISRGSFGLPDSNSLLWAMDSANGFDNTTLSTDKIIWTGTSFGSTTSAPLDPGNYELGFRLDYLGGESTSITISNFHAGLLAPVPEPASLALLGTGALLFLRRRARMAI